jgi:hypothetical protein
LAFGCFTSDQQEDMTELLPSSWVTSSGITEMDNDIPAFDSIREEYIRIISVLNYLSGKKTQQDED